MVRGALRVFRGYCSLFWPIVLIGFLGFWLLSRKGILETLNLTVLVRLWPLMLLAIGIDMLYGRRKFYYGAILGIFTVLILLGLMFIGPRIGLTAAHDLKNEQLTVPVDGAESATILLELTSTDTTISVLETSSENLMEANITYLGDFLFAPEGQENRVITLQKNIHNLLMDWIPFSTQDIVRIDDVQFTATIPTDLTIQANNGNLSADLTNMSLRSLVLNAGNGDIELILPQSDSAYDLQIIPGNGLLSLTIPDDVQLQWSDLNASNGDINLHIGEGVDLDLAFVMSNGTVTFNVHESTGVKINVVNRSNGFIRLPDTFTSSEDIWQSANYREAAFHVNLSVSMSNGTLIIESSDSTPLN